MIKNNIIIVFVIKYLEISYVSNTSNLIELYNLPWL